MKVTFHPALDLLHGALMSALGDRGIVCYSSGPAGKCARNYVRPANPQSNLQLLIRGHLSTCAAGYKALTTTQAAQWEAAARLLERTDILGVKYELTGIGLYCMINVYGLMYGDSLISIPPSTVTPLRPTSITSATINVAKLDIVVDCTGMTNGDVVLARVSAALPGEARNARPGDCRLLDENLTNNFGTVSTEACTISPTMTTYTFTGAERIGILLQPMRDTYMPGLPLLDPNLVVAT